MIIRTDTELKIGNTDPGTLTILVKGSTLVLYLQLRWRTNATETIVQNNGEYLWVDRVV